MRKILNLIFFSGLFSSVLTAQENIIFPKGEMSSTDNHTGTVWLSDDLQQEIIALSKKKWQWMSDKNIDSLTALFDEKAVFVHMGGSWGKEPEINIIKSGGIHYKKTDIHLLAVVGGNEVTNPFIVTEVYVKDNSTWKLGSLSFTKLMTVAD
jgi:hypothetical protein